ncbi:MAG: hypothetical protein ABI411_14775 [Tahibacter sp.]
MFRSARAAASAALFVVLLHALPSAAIQPLADDAMTRASAKLPAHPFIEDRLAVGVSLTPNSLETAKLTGRTAAFEQRYGAGWEMRWDARGDRPNVVQGKGIPLIAGQGNDLAPSQFGVSAAGQIDLGTVAARARDFIASESELLRSKDLELQLDQDRSVPGGDDRSHWFIEFGQYHNGIRVDGSFIFVRVAQGNIVQFGAERVGDIAISTQPSLSREQSFAQAFQELGFPAGTEVAEMSQAGELRIYPMLPSREDNGAAAYSGTSGDGYEHVLAWRYQFRLKGVPGSWEMRVDAQSNRVIDAHDLNVNATITGGIYPTTNSDTEIAVPFPFVSVTNTTAKVTDTLGIYDYSGGTATATLNGKYFQMVDTCGAISLANSSDGNLNFGVSGGTDCITPGVGGAGNTHASRSGFYHLSRINEKARGILPGNSWLQGKVISNMNIAQTCNAGWDGSTLNFFKSGGGCSNTGEIAAVFLHEWGHGLDTNTGGSALPDYASGEAVGDTFAFLETRDSCIGQNFQPGTNCPNCTACTGVRDVGDFSTSGPAVIASPSKVTDNAGINCDRFACPYTASNGTAYRGPMGYEGHCESYIASSANWDLTQALIARFGSSGSGSGWAKMDKIWYASLTATKSAYQRTGGTTCSVTAPVDGCGATNWYTTYLVADDDDGNLANGTPNACRIWDSMNVHGIACGTRPVCSGDAPDFSLAIANSPQSICAGGNATFTVNVGSQLSFVNPVTLSATGQPGASTMAFSPNPVTPGNNSTLTLANTAALPTGSSTLTISGSATGSAGHSATAQVNVASFAPAAITLTAPANAATAVDTSTNFTWAAIAGAQSYTIEVASDSGFATIVASQTGLLTTSWTTTTVLNRSTTYYWRVRATNACGIGANSGVFSFTTANVVCSNPALAIPDNAAAGVDSTLTFSDATVISGLKLKIKTTHTWVGDLKFTLKRGATSIIAIDRPGVPASGSGCNKPNIDVTLDDASATPVEGLCSATSPAISGIAKPNNPLDAPLAGQTFGATWILNVSDAANQDTGTLVQWCLEPKVAAGTTYTVGGHVTGLSGSGLTLDLNSGTILPIGTDGDFTFPTNLLTGAGYAVTVATHPGTPTQTCAVSNGNGSIASASVTNVVVTCTTMTYSVSATVSGLVGSGLTLSINGGADIPVASDGVVNLAAAIPSGTPYSVAVTHLPTNPAEVCSIGNGSGVITSSNVNSIVISCVDRIFGDGFQVDP